MAQVTIPQPREEELAIIASGVRIMALRALADADAAQDVVQETMLRLFDAIRNDRVRHGAPLGAFVRGIARHVIADHRRHAARHQLLHDEMVSAIDADPLQSLITAAEAEQVRSALTELSPEDRETLRLAFVDDLNPRDVAKRLGEPPERIRKRKSRALDRLRQVFLGRFGHDARHEPNDSSGQRSLRLVEDKGG